MWVVGNFISYITALCFYQNWIEKRLLTTLKWKEICKLIRIAVWHKMAAYLQNLCNSKQIKIISAKYCLPWYQIKSSLNYELTNVSETAFTTVWYSCHQAGPVEICTASRTIKPAACMYYRYTDYSNYRYQDQPHYSRCWKRFVILHAFLKSV